MAVAFRSSSALAGASATSAAYTVPAGGVSGDMGVVVMYAEFSATVTLPDATWFEVTGSPLTLNENFGAGSGRARIYYSLAPALSGSWTFSWTGSAWRSGAAVLISGRTGTGYPFGTQSTFEANASSIVLPAVTVATTGDGIITLLTQNSSKDIAAAPSPFTERQDNDEVYIAVADNATAGSTGTKTFVSSSGGDVHAWMAPILANSGGGGGGGSSNGDNQNQLVSPAMRVPPFAFMPGGELRWQTSPAGAPPPPVTVPDPPYFTTIGGSTPQFIVSSEDWAVLCNGVINNGGNYQTTYDNYFTTRAAQGYNAIEVTSFSVVSYEGGNDGPDYDNVYPFTGNSLDPLGTRNTAWWDRRDYFFSSAAAHGFRVFCNISSTYLGLGAFTASWSNAQWTAWGNHLAAKYPASTHPHIFWLVGDDYFATVESGLDALYAALNSGGATQPKSIQWFQEATSRKSIYDGSTPGTNQWRVNAEFNWGYSYNPWYDVTEKMGVENSTLTPIPYIAADGFFLSTGPTGLTDEQMMRRMCWWAISSGVKGLNTGNNVVYPWAATSYSVVTSNTFYTNVMPAIATAVNSWPNWHLLVADTSSELVTAGRGTRITPIQSGDPQYLDNSDSFVSASYIKASSHAGELAVIYMSHASTITIDQTKMVAGYTATWVDPANGATSSATPGPTYNSGSKGNNSDGQADWVLVLKAASGTSVTGDASLTGTGTITAAGSLGAVAGATLNGTGTITAAGLVAHSAGATLSGTGTITTDGVVAHSSGATLSGTGTITAAGQLAAVAGASINGVGTITADGASTGAGGSVSLAGIGTITVAGSVGVAAGASIAGTGTITADGVRATSSGATLTGTGTILALSGVSAGATLSGTGTLTAAGQRGVMAAASLNGSAALTAVGTLQARTTVALAGVGTITADGSLVQAHALPTEGVHVTITVSKRRIDLDAGPARRLE